MEHMLFRCFISHPWAEQTHHFAQRLAAALREKLVHVWIDEEQMRAGEDIKVRQRNGIIYETDIFLFVLSPKTLLSQNCMEELETAIDSETPIVCALLERCQIPLKLQDYIIVDFSSPVFFEASVERLVSGASKLNQKQKILEKLEDDDPEIRSEAARILRDLRDPSTLRPVIRRISIERDDTVKYWLLVAIGNLIEPNSQDGIQALNILDHIESCDSPLLKQGVNNAREKIMLRFSQLKPKM